MKKLITTLLLVCGSAFAQGRSGQGSYNQVGSLFITDSTPYAFLRVQSISSGIIGAPGFYFKTSSDGKTWRTISTNEFSFYDSTANAQCFTPNVLWWNNNFWVGYDIFATVSPISSTTNREGLVRSPDLVHWTNIGPVTLPTVNGVSIWGARWYMEANQPYLTFASGWPGVKKCYISHPLDANMATWSTPIMIVNSGSPGGAYDPSIVKSGGTYYCFVADDFIKLYTNNTLTTAFTLKTANVIPSQTFSNLLEGPCVVPIPGGWRMYAVGDPKGIAQMYYADSTDLTTWTTPQEVTENGSIGDNGSVLALGKAEANVVEALDVSLLTPTEKVYDIYTVPGANTANGLTNWPGDASVVSYDWRVEAIGSGGQYAYFSLHALATSENLDNESLIGNYQILNQIRPSTSWSAQVLDVPSSQLVYLSVTGPNDQTVRWRVHQRIESVSMPPQFTGVTTDGTALPDFLLNPQLQSLKVTNSPIFLSGVITNGFTVWLSTNATPPTLAYPNGSLATTSDGGFWIRTNSTWVRH